MFTYVVPLRTRFDGPVVVRDGVVVFDDILCRGDFKPLEIPHLQVPLAPRIVPVRRLDADENADHDDEEVQPDRRPVLVIYMLRDAAQERPLVPRRVRLASLLDRDAPGRLGV